MNYTSKTSRRDEFQRDEIERDCRQQRLSELRAQERLRQEYKYKYKYHNQAANQDATLNPSSRSARTITVISFALAPVRHAPRLAARDLVAVPCRGGGTRDWQLRAVAS
jgi:hypothetical protein